MSPELYQTCFLIIIAYILYLFIGNWGPVLYCGALIVYVLFLCWLRHIFAEMILWSKDTPSNEKYVSQLKALFIHLLFMSI